VIRTVDALEPFRVVLREGGYALESRDLPELGATLLAETEHSLVLCIATRWETLDDRVDEAQAQLTRLAAVHPSPRSWDLYVIVVVTDDRDNRRRESVESDTRYARKIVAVGVGESRARAERALLALLPLRPTARFDASDPLVAVRDELVAQGVDVDVARTALASFARNGTVEIP
jgi:hypothetical protein